MKAAQTQLIAPQRRSDHHGQANALKISTWEGCVATVMVALTAAFYIPYLDRLGATEAEIGLAFSLPVLLGGLVQLFTPLALRYFGTRKSLIVSAVLIQALFYVPLAFTWMLPGRPGVWATISAFSVSALAGGIHGPAWQDWMAVLTPRRIRGKYFGKRNRIFSTIQLLVSVSGGLLLDQGKGEIGKTMVLFAAIWAACAIIRTASGIMLAIQYEPRTTTPPGILPTISFLQFMRDIRRTQFGKFTLYNGLLSFGNSISAPFFAVFVLKDLDYKYTNYSILMTIVPTLAIIAVNPIFGRFIDRLGPVVPMKLFALGIILNPFLWVFNTSLPWLVIVQIFAGIVWAGYMLSVFSYSMEALDPDTRVSSISYFNVLNSIAVFAGAAAGGLIAPHLPTVAKYPLQSIFLLSGIMRFFPAVMIQFLKHNRKTRGDATTLEKFMSDPLLILRTGVVGRSPFARIFRRPTNY